MKLRKWLSRHHGACFSAICVCDSKAAPELQPRPCVTHLYWMLVALRDGESERKREKCQLSGSLIDSFSHLPPPQKKPLKHQRKHKRLASEARPQPSPSITCTKTCINMSAFTFPSKGACLVHTAVNCPLADILIPCTEKSSTADARRSVLTWWCTSSLSYQGNCFNQPGAENRLSVDGTDARGCVCLICAPCWSTNLISWRAG